MEIKQADSGLCLFGLGEPASHIDAKKEKCWEKAMREELTSIESNGTWVLCDLPKGHKPIGLKWVYKLKKDPDGAIVKHKARLVTKGYVQRQGVDFDEVFAPVARMESVRLLVALAAEFKWKIHHMDVKSAFLNGDLNEEVYVCQPPGFEVTGEDSKVYRLKKALYGLKQAPRACNSKLDATLSDLGFERCPSESGLYKKQVDQKALIVGVYVDDLIITGGSDRAIEDFKKQMKSKFSMSDLGLLSYYLGIEVKQTEDAITLCQSAYAARILEKMGMSICNPMHTPMEARLKMSKNSQAEAVDATQYRSVVGSLRYLIHTRPDLSYSVGFVSRFMEKPTAEMSAVKHILKYVKGTLNLGCCYSKGERSKFQLIGYSDSDLGGDIDDRKSTIGVLSYLGKNPLTWASQKQKVVAMSSCEAEYVAAASAACQGIWLARLLGELLDCEPEKWTLKIDNQSAIALGKNPVFHERSKHIDICYHFVRDCVEEGKVAVEHVRSEEQHADILIKPLPKSLFQEMKKKIGMQDLKPVHQV